MKVYVTWENVRFQFRHLQGKLMQLNVGSLMWDNIASQNDLDIHVDCQLDGGTEGVIYYSNKNVGGGLLDVDAREGVREPVENVFWDISEAGNFTCSVNNFKGVKRKEWMVCLRAKVPITLLKEDGTVQERAWTGTRQVRGVCEDVNHKPFAFKFRVDTSRQLKNVSARPTEVATQIKRMTDLNLVVIDSSEISGWETGSSKWPFLKKNITDFVSAAGSNGHLIKASNQAAVRTAFQSVASMMSERSYKSA